MSDWDELWERWSAILTLKDLGTPWAECYQGSGRPTGLLAETPVYCENGDVAPGWSYVGDMTRAEFDRDFVYQEHDACHTPSWSDWNCPHCVELGWAE